MVDVGGGRRRVVDEVVCCWSRRCSCTGAARGACDVGWPAEEVGRWLIEHFTRSAAGHDGAGLLYSETWRDR